MIDISKYDSLYTKSYMDTKGKVTKVVGLTVDRMQASTMSV